MRTEIRKRNCPVCGKGVLHARIIDETFTYEVPTAKVSVSASRVPLEICDACGERFSGPRAALIRNRAVGQALGLLSPEQIHATRSRWRLSLARFARLTGIDEELLADWEKGRRLPSRAFDNYLRLLGAPGARAVLRVQRAG